LLAWEDLSAVDRRALTEMLVDKIIIKRHPSKITRSAAPLPHPRHPIPNPQQEAERLKSVHEARVKIVPRSEQQIAHRGRTQPQLCTAEVQLMGARNREDRVFCRALPAGEDLTACARARQKRNLLSGCTSPRQSISSADGT
jgi:hypothetical protein